MKKKNKNSVIMLVISGNMGNQLFQFCTALSLMKEYSYQRLLVYFQGNFVNQIKCFDRFYTEVNYSTFRQELGFFKRFLLLIKHSKSRLLAWFPLSDSFKRFYYCRDSFYKRFGIFENYSLGYSKLLLKGRKIYISGYFESRHYFEKIINKSFIKQYLFSNCSFNPKFNQLFTSCRADNSVCVSVRRGDFLSPKYKDTFYVCDEEYFKRAFDIIKNHIENPVFIFFSDDVEWVKSNMSHPNNSLFEPPDLSIAEKLFLMSLCNNFILSNSTFSWWGWYLSNHCKSVIVSPKSWRADSHLDHLIESDWFLIG